jgi:tRNA (cytidine/uridine-2'-O-)-methyltransferase
LRRAGLDYWKKLAPSHYENWQDFLERAPTKRLWLTSTKAVKHHTQVAYKAGDGIVIGQETKGLPEYVSQDYGDCLVKIPMPGDFHRSLNQSQATAIVLYEALRQVNGW